MYRFVYSRPNGTKKQYLIVASSGADAKRTAKDIVKKNALKYRGLAKLAIGMLMYKACSKSAGGDSVNSRTRNTAFKNSSASFHVNGNIATLTLLDELKYAMAALKNGQNDLNTAVQKAANKVASILNRRCANIREFKPLEQPFPEVASRRG